MIPFRMHVDPAPARTNEVQDEHGQLEPATLILFNAVLVDDPEIASSSIFDQGAVLEKAYCCYVKGGERVLATFVVIGILVTEVVPPVLLTWPTSWPTKLQLNIEQVCGTFGMQQCSGCFRFHFFKALYAAGLAWLGYLSHKCPLESHVFHPWQNDKRSRSMDNIILTDIMLFFHLNWVMVWMNFQQQFPCCWQFWSIVSQQFSLLLLPLPLLLEARDSQILIHHQNRKADHDTELDPAETSETTSIPNLEEATSFIRHDLPSYVCMAGHRDLGLAAAQVLAWG